MTHPQYYSDMPPLLVESCSGILISIVLDIIGSDKSLSVMILFACVASFKYRAAICQREISDGDTIIFFILDDI
jgi:hypothetical protein